MIVYCIAEALTALPRLSLLSKSWRLVSAQRRLTASGGSLPQQAWILKFHFFPYLQTTISQGAQSFCKNKDVFIMNHFLSSHMYLIEIVSLLELESLGLASSAAGYACLVTALCKLYNITGDTSVLARYENICHLVGFFMIHNASQRFIFFIRFDFLENHLYIVGQFWM